MTAAAHIRRRLADGETLIGTFVKVASTDVLDVAAAAELDFVVLDHEHAALDDGALLALTSHADLLGLPCVVRVDRVDAGLINRLLERGATGIQLSTVEVPAQVGRLVEATRYPPAGRRSVSLTHRRARFGAVDVHEHVSNVNDDPPLLIGQLETSRAFSGPLTELIDGLDIAFVGETDLLVSVRGDTGLLEEHRAALARAAHNSGVWIGGFSGSTGAVSGALGREWQYVVVGSDLQMLAGQFRALSGVRSVDGARP